MRKYVLFCANLFYLIQQFLTCFFIHTFEMLFKLSYSVDLDDAAAEFRDLEARAAELDPDELMDARPALREDQEQRATSMLKDNYGKQYEPDLIKRARSDVAELLNEPKPDEKPRSVRKRLQEKQAEVEQRERKRQKKKEKDWER